METPMDGNQGRDGGAASGTDSRIRRISAEEWSAILGDY